MTYEAWRCAYQSSEQAARAAYNTVEKLAREKQLLLEALREARRAIGDHYAPEQCYATGHMTGNVHRDLVQCPACSAIELYKLTMDRLGEET